MCCCSRTVSIETEAPNLPRGAAFVTEPEPVLSLFQRMISEAQRGAKGLLAPNQDFAFEVIGSSEGLSTGGSVTQCHFFLLCQIISHLPFGTP